MLKTTGRFRFVVMSALWVTGMFLLAATLHPPWTSTLMTVAAGVSLLLALVGFVQVFTTVRRRLVDIDA